MYVIVDIETTGGDARHSRITEIAIYRYEEGRVVDEFVSLINPESYIPDFITQLTGISNEMVEDAPRFFEVAKRIVEITQGTTFVAHNSAFDYSYIKAEFAGLGYNFDMPTLCTVKLARALLPGHPSYSLGNLCADLGISINGRHRAGGDALATVKLFEILLEVNGGFILPDNPYKRIDFGVLSPLLSLDLVKSLPASIGVYYLKNAAGDIIYVGRSKNIRTRVLEHLSGGKTQKQAKMATEIADVDSVETGSELVALLHESEEISKLQPLYNKALKGAKLPFGLQSYTDRNGYLRLSIIKGKELYSPIASFATIEEARQGLFKWVDEFGLCQKLCGLYEGQNGCFQYQLNQCTGACVGEEGPAEYNLKVQSLIVSLELGYKNTVIIEKGRVPNEFSLVFVENGSYKGYGYIASDEAVYEAHGFKEYIKPKEDTRDARQIIRQYLKNHKPMKLINF